MKNSSSGVLERQFARIWLNPKWVSQLRDSGGILPRFTCGVQTVSNAIFEEKLGFRNRLVGMDNYIHNPRLARFFRLTLPNLGE